MTTPTVEQHINIDMNKFGIGMSVNVTASGFSKFIEDLKSPNGSFYDDGIDKKHFYADLQVHLRTEDMYFNLNPAEISETNDRWKSFGGECILLAALDVVLYGNPVAIFDISGEKSEAEYWVYESSDSKHLSATLNAATLH